MTVVTDEERIARATLLRISEPAMRGLVRHVRVVGAQQAVADIAAGASVPDVSIETLQVRLRGADGSADIAAADSIGARLVCPGDAQWPQPLDDLAWIDADCFGLWVRGPANPDAVGFRAVAIVGTRAPTDYGLYVASEFGAGLAERDWAVVSGLAFGIDGAAHRGALAAGGMTAAFLACGVDLAYPRGHAALYEQICAEGLVMSEHSPGVTPQRPRFLVRNRLIAAFAAGAVVVEMAPRSGAASTARHAARLQRHVMVVPGPITSLTSSGCHQYVRDNPGAVLVTRVEEIVEQCGHMGELAEPLVGPTTARDRLGPAVARVLEGVPATRPAGADVIAVAAGVPLPVVTAALAALEHLGLVEQTGDGWRMSALGRRDRRDRRVRRDFGLDEVAMD